MTERRKPEGRGDKPPRSDRAAGGGDNTDDGTDGSARTISPRRERYLVAPLPPELLPAGLNVAPLDANRFLAQLNADPATTVCKVIGGLGQQGGLGGQDGVGMFGVAPAGLSFPDVVVVEMDPERALAFDSMPMVHIEPDLPLQYAVPEQAGDASADPGLALLGADVGVDFEVCGTDGKPLPDAEVYVMSESFPVRGTTDGDGRVVLAVPTAVLGSVTGLYVKPKYDYWSTWHPRPDLLPGVPNLVVCPSLAESFPGFPSARELSGWAREALQVDALPPTFRGHGVKVGIVDSGAAVDHPDLTGRFAGGRDITSQTDDGWRVDTMGHGSHCAGIIGGRDDGQGIRGIAPEAELHSCKVFPGGRFSDLIEALDYCIVNRIDVVNLSLGGGAPSELITRKIEQARQAGVACVVAAGNSGGPVSFPASLSNVLSVAALGRIGVYPAGTYHATQEFGTPTPDGYYSAKFTCFGPEIDVVAPGVAVVSSVPPANYAAWDGTSFAGPCVAGLAALTLAHHPDFRTRFTTRGAARVDRLFEIIRGSCRPLLLGDPGRSGAGIPDATVALGLAMPSTDALGPLRAVMSRAGLLNPAYAPLSTPVPGATYPTPSATMPPGSVPSGSVPTESMSAGPGSAGAKPSGPKPSGSGSSGSGSTGAKPSGAKSSGSGSGSSEFGSSEFGPSEFGPQPYAAVPPVGSATSDGASASSPDATSVVPDQLEADPLAPLRDALCGAGLLPPAPGGRY